MPITTAAALTSHNTRDIRAAPIVGDDQNGTRTTVSCIEAALRYDSRRSGLFAKNCSENPVDCCPEAGDVAGQASAFRRAAESQFHVSIRPFMHEVGHLFEQRKKIERLLSQPDRPTVELSDVAQLRDDRHQPRARFLRLVDHAALALAHRRFLILLQHSQIAADDAGGRAELVDRERNQRRIGVIG